MMQSNCHGDFKLKRMTFASAVALHAYLLAARTSRDECRRTVPSVSSSSAYVNTPVRQAEHV